jgi:beta-glucosidase
METGTADFYNGALLDAVRNGQVSEALVDRSVLRILRTMFAIGLFDTDYTPTAIPVQEHGQIARRFRTKRSRC